jgi:predicted metal-dependent HD superfamily phosphohydrolase
VRVEYAHVADPDWRVGRSAVLRSFLDREHVFATAPMRAARERRARANLSAEIAELSRRD